ncbi:hypothetical protein MCP_0782 [Methanocella paludicola SANAE]|uniref:Uncharacterized protein n=1 Tax=Methanocella paludicola (strain DSM 17711 / JCM 13418 / NBRC 101707 / SANAE) TaxID=304371 RepID=D1YWN2_METPS|nr:hypothetical protein [Methanocella paludicola]BAI60854.1 hypothetical protein MCP_0782 [Methanocella paludicola SANAE]
MTMRSLNVGYIHSIWILTTLAILIYFQSLSIERFFVLYFIGFMVLEKLLRSPEDSPRFTMVMNVIMVIGVFVFIMLMLNVVLTIFIT